MFYHGTSLQRASSIMRDGVIKVAPHGVKCVSMTDDARVACYFAALAADCDGSVPVILPIDADRLRTDGFDIELFEDQVYGEGECAWERETACWQDIPISYMPIEATRPEA